MIQETEVTTEIIETEKNEDGTFVMIEETLDVDALIAELEGSVVKKDESVEAFLDRTDDDREEWSRIAEDLYPEDHPSGPTRPTVHRSTDRIQAYLAKERADNYEPDDAE